MTPDTDTNNPPPVQPVQPPVTAQAASAAPAFRIPPSPAPRYDANYCGDRGWFVRDREEMRTVARNLPEADAERIAAALNASAAPPAPAPAPVAAAKTMPLDDYLLLSGMLRISQQHARAWGLYDEQGNPIYPAGVLSHPFQADKLPATADAPALLRASLVQPATVAADADLDALLALVRGMVAAAKGADTQGAWWIDEADGGEVVADAMDHGDAAHIAACNPAAIQRLGELVERLVARCRQQPAQRGSEAIRLAALFSRLADALGYDTHAEPDAGEIVEVVEEWARTGKRPDPVTLVAKLPQAQQPAQEAQKP